MIKYKLPCLIVLALIPFVIYGQSYTPYQWQKKQSPHKLTEKDGQYDLYFIEKNVVYDYVYDKKSGNLICYQTNHNTLKVNNDQALNESNKVYIPMYNTLELVDFKGRVLTKNGKIKTFDETNMKELESEDRGYKILAIEGAEVGSEIEYFFTRKVNPSNFITLYLQDDVPILDYNLFLSSPENLEYDFKVYNSDQQVTQENRVEGFNNYELSIKEIVPLFEEEFAAYKNSLIRLEAKLAYNSVKGDHRLFTWGDAGRRIYELVGTSNTSEEKAFNKFFAKLELPEDPTEAFKSFEDLIKRSYYYAEEAGDDGKLLDQVIGNKYANSQGFTKLYVAALNTLNLPYSIVLTSNRYEKEFDPLFDTWNYLDEYLIYLPTEDKYMSPKNIAFRLGTISDEYIDTYGIHVTPKMVQDFMHPVASLKKIGADSYEKNFDNMNIKVVFDEALESNSVDLVRAYSGYSASYYKTAMLFVDKEQKKEIIDEVFTYLALDADITESSVQDTIFTYQNWHEPFVVEGRFKTSSYIENAGNVVLFKVGELIGPQSELYQEKKRELDVVNSFNRGYLRKIQVELPKNHQVENLESLKIHKEVKDGEQLIYLFESDYTLTENILEIKIDEYYDRISYPKENFEEFRKVINAAADFNKVVLVISQNM
jgi:hypothetical protein